MFVMKADHPDFGVILEMDVEDSEGNNTSLPASWSVQATSTDPSVIQVTPGIDPLTYSLHVGVPGLATFNVLVLDGGGNVKASAAESFTVIPGDAQNVTIGTLSFTGFFPE